MHVAILGTTDLRRAWSPACRGPWLTITLFGGAKVSVRPMIGDATLALNAVLVAFGYPAHADETGAFVCRPITGGGGYSLHAYGIAIDINWRTNLYGRRLVTDMPLAMVNAICAIRTNNGKQVWGAGRFYDGNIDAMHFEIVCTPADIRTGINTGTVLTIGHVLSTTPSTPNNPIPFTPMEDDDMDISFQQPPGQGVYMFRAGVRYPIRTWDEFLKLQVLAKLGGGDPNVHGCDQATFDVLSHYALDGAKLSAAP